MLLTRGFLMSFDPPLNQNYFIFGLFRINHGKILSFYLRLTTSNTKTSSKVVILADTGLFTTNMR